jgi:ElaA protein
MSEGRLEFVWSRLDELSPPALYAVLKLRVDVFVVEQQCPYAEIDGKDGDALHLRALDGGELAGYLRVLPPVGEGPARIGRVVVASSHRGRKLGAKLMLEAIGQCRGSFPARDIELSAQSPLQAFYGAFGFRPVSAEYVEDGIPHIDMRLAAAQRETANDT